MPTWSRSTRSTARPVWLGRLTGHDHVSRRLDIVSRYPLIDPPGSRGRYAFVELAPGQVAAVSNVHLASARYSPRGLLDGGAGGRCCAPSARCGCPRSGRSLRR